MTPPDLIQINKDLAVSPRLYRLIQLMARTSWGNDLEWYLKDMQDLLIDCGRNFLHEYTRCINSGLTREELYELEEKRIRRLAAK